MPFISPDMMRKAAMYCATRLWMTCQPAITTMMVIKELSRMNHTERPSIPR